MIDSFGQPQSVLVLGGASDIALATVQELVSRRCRSVVLAGRRPEVLDQAANQIRRYGPGFPESAGKELDTLAPGQPEDPEFLPRAQEHLRVDTAYFDALDFRSHERVIADVFQRFGEMDLVIIAFGILGDNIDPTEDPEGAARIIDVNFAGAVSAILSTVTQLREQGHGKIVVLSSVAGLRVRKSNFVYGASKAGLDGFCQGLADSLIGTGISLMIVRPGFVKTKMTESMKPAPLATSPEAVAKGIVDGLGSNKLVLWSPPAIRYLMAVLRLVPRSIFRRLPI